MFNQAKKNHPRRALDQVGGALLRAQAQANADAAEKAAAAPFLYARLKARINDELRRREETERARVWNLVAQRTLPLLGLLAVCALAVFLFINAGVYAPPRANENALFYGSETSADEMDRVVFNDTRALSRDDVLTSILDDAGEGRNQAK